MAIGDTEGAIANRRGGELFRKLTQDAAKNAKAAKIKSIKVKFAQQPQGKGKTTTKNDQGY